MLQPLDQRLRLAPFALGQPRDMDFVLAVGALGGDNHHPATIVRHFGPVAQVGLFGRGIDQLVSRLRGADLVIPDCLVLVERLEFLPRLHFGEARIEKALVADPGNPGELGPLDLVLQDLTGDGVEHLDRAPVRSAVLNRIGQQLAVLRGFPIIERGRAVLGPGVGIEQQARRTGEALADEQL